MTDISAPIFAFGEPQNLNTSDAHTRLGGVDGMLALTGPSVTAEPGRLPVRGDLAHIKLAGRYFVPHYAAPMPHRVTAPIGLLSAARLDSGEICQLPSDAWFDVLDIAGGWAWGQFGEDGPVGYVLMSGLEAQ